MKKLALFAVAAMALGGVGVAHAAPILTTAAGDLGVASDGYILVADGAVGNPDPLDGYVGITDGGSFECNSEGGPYSGGSTAGCNPQPPA